MELIPFTGKLDAGPELEPFKGKLDPPQLEPFTGKLDGAPVASKEEQAPGFLEHMGKVLADVQPFTPGTISPDMVPSQIGNQMALGAAGAVRSLEQTWLTHPDNLGAQADPQAQERVAQLKRDEKISGGLVKEIQAPDNAIARTVGDAAQSVPGSVASLVPAALGAPMIPAVAGGLAANYALETASDFTQRQNEFKQHPQDAWGPANLHGAVATGLEMLPLGAAVKYMKGAAKLGTTALKVGAGEFVQEGLTRGFDDTLTNAEGFTKFTPEQRLENALKAGAQGLLMVPMMGPVAHAVRKGQEYGVKKELEKLEKDQKAQEFSQAEAVRELMRALVRDLDAGQAPLGAQDVELTAEEAALARVVREQMKNGLDVAPTEEGKAWGAQLDASVGRLQAEGATLQGEEMPVRQDEGGVSDFVMQKRQDRYDPSALRPSQRAITFATDENVLGLTLEQTGELPEGSVVAIGGKPENFPQTVFQPAMETLQGWVQQHMPNARIVLNLEQFSDEDTFGNHMVIGGKGGITHVITPMDMTNMGKHGVSDPKTSMAFMTALAHEFGHALKDQAFMDGLQYAKIPMQLRNALRGEMKAGLVSPELLAAIAEKAPEEAALVQEWQQVRGEILSGKYTAIDFMDNWVGVRKLGNSLLKTQGKSLYSWAEERLGKRIEGVTALELIGKISKNVEQYLSFDEYMAEQFARHAYSSGSLAASPLGRFFAKTLERLRNLFRELKSYKGSNGERVVQPGETFAAWLEKGTKRAGRMHKRSGKFTLSEAVQKAQKASLEEGPKAPPEQVPVPKDIELTQVDLQTRLEALIADMLYRGELEEGKPRYHAIKGMMKRGQYLEAKAKIEDTLGENLNWDREYASKVLERLPNKERIKAETLRATIANQEIRKAERVFWEEFLAEHAEGFSKLDLALALQKGALPLTAEFETRHANHGVFNAGLFQVTDSAVSVIWTIPGTTVGSVHFQSIPNYLMHSRRVEYGQKRFVLELQSDVFQEKGDDLVVDEGYSQELAEQVQAIKQIWWKRLIREEVTAAFEDGKTVLYFPTAETVQLIEGWEQEIKIQEYNGVQFTDFRNRDVTLTGSFTLSTDGETALAQTQQGGYAGITAEDSPAAARILKDLQRMPKYLGENQGIYDRYKGEIAKFLKTEYKAVQVEVNGRNWLKVDPSVQGNKVYNWDRDNPVQPPHPEMTLVNFAGMEEGDYRKPEVVAEASEMWGRLKEESPFFKRWFGESKILAGGKPQVVWRGVGNKVSYLDATTRGGLTGVQSARKAFWFTDNHTQAGFYMDEARKKPRTVLEDGPKREAQKIRQKLEGLKDLLGEMGQAEDPRKELVWKRMGGLQEKLDRLFEIEGNTRAAQPAVQGFYLRMENPLVKDGAMQPYDDRIYTAWLLEAQAGGHDGLVVKNTHDPLESTVYAIFEPVQAKLEDNIGTFDLTDELHWDRESPGQEAVRNLSKNLQHFWPKAKLRANNLRAKAVDTFVQLQQVAAAQPEEVFLNTLLRLTGSAEVMKNNLQYDAEELAKRMASMVGSSKETVVELGRVLDKEWRSGVLQSTLVGKDAQGNVVWGGDAGVAGYGAVVNWEVQDTLGLRRFMLAQGIDVTTERGAQVLDFYIQVRNVFLKQFKGLEVALRDKAEGLYENAPSVLKAERLKIRDLMAQLRGSPFVPQGNFGNYVVIVQKDQGERQENGRRFVTIRKTHYEKKEDYQIALAEAFAKARKDKSLKVKSRVLEDETGIPMQLPANLLDKLAETGAFTDDQIELMADMMVSPKYDKVAERYLGAEKIEGANQDFGKVFSAFTWHNSNYIWKMYYRAAFNGQLSMQRTEIRKMDQRTDIAPEELVQVLERKRRNLGIMEKSVDYMLHPPGEFQQARLFITMAYLAFNPLTAVMNFSTQFNTWAAVTSEYGELNGNRLYLQGLREVAQYFMLDSRIVAASGKEKQRLMELKVLYEKAIKGGVIDQSYAYFLAGQANTSGGLMATSNDAIGRTSHVAMEAGMLLFRSVEKANRLGSLITFYEAERGAGNTLNGAYEVAVQKTNLLQNSFTAANKPEFARGKKAILFMFSSFAQHMAWITAGGYERASRKSGALAGRRQAALWHGTTMKLWLVYLLLGGLTGVPFADTVMALVKFLWRKVFGATSNPELELRKFAEEVGMDSNVVMHGRLHNVGGFDLSGRFGLGRLLPGSDLLSMAPRNAEEMLGKSILAFSGPAGGMYQDLFKATLSLSKGEFGEAAKEAPGAVGYLAKAMDATMKQNAVPTAGVTTKDGTRMTFDAATGEFRDLTTKELMGMAIGATPTILAENREERFFEISESLYWNTRRADMLDKYKKAVRTNDEAGREAIRNQIEVWNDSDLPDRGLRITGRDLGRSTRAQRKHVQASEQFGTNSKKNRGVVEPIRELYRED